VFGCLIGAVARGFTWKQRGDARLASSSLLLVWGSRAPGRRWACSSLDHAWSEGTQYQCLNEAPVTQRGPWPRNSDFASFLLLLLTCHSFQISTIVHSVVLPTIYIHRKIEANLLKSVAYKTLVIHAPFINPLLYALFYCKTSN